MIVSSAYVFNYILIAYARYFCGIINVCNFISFEKDIISTNETEMMYSSMSILSHDDIHMYSVMARCDYSYLNRKRTNRKIVAHKKGKIFELGTEAFIDRYFTMKWKSAWTFRQGQRKAREMSAQTFPNKFLQRDFYEVVTNHIIGIGTIFKKKTHLIEILPFETLMVARALYG